MIHACVCDTVLMLVSAHSFRGPSKEKLRTKILSAGLPIGTAAGEDGGA